MRQSNPMKLIPHVHAWILSGQENKPDGTFVQLFRCSICDKVKRK